MINKFWPKIIILVFLFLICSNPSQAFYKKKVFVGEFENPVGWDEDYVPGDVLAKLLTQELKRGDRIHLVTSQKPLNLEEPEENMAPTESNWPVNLGEEAIKASLFIIKAKILNFTPNKTDIPPMADEADTSFDQNHREIAELSVYVELVQNKTGRVIAHKTFKTLSRVGKIKFSSNIIGMHSDKSMFSSMDYALNNLKSQIGSFVIEVLETQMLEGEIISVDRKIIDTKKKSKKPVIEENYLVNLGSANGVHVGDIFKVHAVGLGLLDPYTGNDLGDIYVKTGVVKILQVWEGFSKAQALGGTNFKKGFLIQSTTETRKGEQMLTRGNNLENQDIKIPRWDFNGIRSVN